MTRIQDVDAGFVASKRALGAGWGAIARMAGCSETDLRRKHDLRFMAEVRTGPELEENPRDVVAMALRQIGVDADEALVLARLWMAKGGRCRSNDLAAGIAGGNAAYDVCRAARATACRLGIGFVIGGVGFALSAEGVVRISELTGHVGRRP